MRNVSACITSSIHLGIFQSQSVWTLAATIFGTGGRAKAVGKVNPEGLDFGGFHSRLVILIAGEMEHLMDHLGSLVA